jgi:hypothetical protein
MRNEKSKVQSAKLPLKAVAIVALVLLALSTAVISVDAHMPGAKAPPAFELAPIVITDDGTEVEITIEDVGNYHNERMTEFKRNMLKKQNKTDEEIDKIIEKEFAGVTGICPCSSCAFRAALLGIAELWGDEIPERADIKFISRRPTPGATQCLQYITGTGPKVPDVTSKGELQMILPDGTEVTDLSVKNLKKHMADMDLSTWNFVTIRKSTGDEFEVQVKEGVHPEGFSELRKKVKVEKTATPEEMDEFRVQWEAVRDAFLTQPDWELFEGIEEPEEEEPDIVGGAIFFSILVIGLISLLALVYSRKKAR